MAAIKALEQWCKVQCDGYRDVAITNMTTSFRNGMAFCALLHKYRPDLIDYDSLRKEDVLENNRLAFQIAEEKLGIPALLDAEDMVALRVPDRLSILTYVSQYYNYFKGRPPTGGVKRPAEGSKEEPSEKKNLPLVAKTYVSKTASESHAASAVAARGSTKPSAAAAQEARSSAHANRSGTLTSRCAACGGHVHLVQRHLVDGKLYHRSCFKCVECSSVLHPGGYKPGKTPGTFSCTAHQNRCKPFSSELGIVNGPVSSAVRAVGASRAQLPPSGPSTRPSPDPVPPGPSPTSASWTASAQKTQAARQRFFQAAPPAAGTPGGHRKPDLVPDERNGGKKLAEENRNNNNKRRFSVRAAADAWSGEKPSSAGSGAEGIRAGRQENRTRPAGPLCREWQFALGPVKAEPRLTGAESELQRVEVVSNISDSSTSVATAPTVPPVSWTPSDPARGRTVSPPEPPFTSATLGFKPGNPPPVKAPPRPPAVETVPTEAPSNHGAPSGAKKGKYLSPTNTSKTEMRSPSVGSSHVPAEQIERELSEIESSLARLERDGVELEKQLRSCEEEGEGDVLMDPLMVDWFSLIRKKQMYIRKESELVYIARTQDLERQQPGVEWELRRLLEKPDHSKSREEQQREEALMQRLVEIVDGRNAIVDGLDLDRLREVEEDQQLNEMMKNLRVKKAKSKRKSSISKLFRRRSKRRVE
ncbi:MICAL-like protein 2a isoform X2 [Betta splendens]|uniref:MICAL-like protein 2a isoform X2 n=1 Tax=Betta splendens TaxID=158456 RepID=A0A6P7NAE3_BETSP|nr:MICAL-like protein 2a isoform X2 [Betta splendens]